MSAGSIHRGRGASMRGVVSAAVALVVAVTPAAALSRGPSAPEGVGRIATTDARPRVAAAAAGCTAFGPGTVTVFDVNLTVKPADPAACGFQGADLTSAQNEFESFQIVVRAPAGTALTNLRISRASCFSWCAADAAGADAALTIYREAYHTIYRRSDLESLPDPVASSANPDGAGVRWPDALIPVKDYFFNEPRNAFPVDVPAGESRVAWVDVLVPSGQAAGAYTAQLSVTADANGAPLSLTVPISLTVLGFGLPSTPTLDSTIGVNQNRLCAAFDPTPASAGCTQTELWQIDGLISRLAVENRLALTYANPTYLGNADGATQKASFRTWVKPYLIGTSAARLPGANMRNILVYTWCASDPGCVNGLAQIAAGEDWAGKTPVFSVYCEELFTSVDNWRACKSGWDTARAAWTAAGATGLGLIAVASIDALRWARTNSATLAWPSVFSDVTTLLPIVQYLNSGDTDARTAFPGNIAAYDEFLNQAGSHRLWDYTSCVSMGCATNDSADLYLEDTSAYFRGWPAMGIDQPPTEARAMSWLDFRWGKVTGEQYYESLERTVQGFDDCTSPKYFDHSTCLFSEGASGDGTLLYPGTVARIGGTHAIPLESMRIKRMREGREDYEWLKWLSDRGQGTFARDTAASLFPHAYCTDSPAPVLPAGEPLPAVPCSQTATVAGSRAALADRIRTVLAPSSADLRVTAAVPASAPLGDDYRIDISVTDGGPQGSTGTMLVDALPVGVRARAITPTQGTCTTATQPDTSIRMTCSLGTLASGVTAHVTAVLASASGGLRTQALSVSGAVSDPAPANDTASAATSVFGAPNCNIVGTNGSDSITGTAAADVICGLAGNDTIHGLGANDVIYGGSGADTLYGDENDDVLIGGLGSDDDMLDGGTGTDAASVFDAAAGAGVNLALGQSFDWDLGPGDANIGSDTLVSIESASGSPYGDALVGGSGNNRLDGGAGDDVVDDVGGDDVILGGTGNDSISAAAGNDVVYGGPGNDRLDGGPGSDTIAYGDITRAVQVTLATTAAQDTVGAGSDTITAAERLSGSLYDDTLSGGTGPDTLSGGGGNDILSGGDGNDLLYGNAGDDRLAGGAGDDTFVGGAGDDDMDPGAGSDQVSVPDALSGVTIDLRNSGSYCNDGAPLTGGGTCGLGFDQFLGSSPERVAGSPFGDRMVGSPLSEVFQGGSGNDSIEGDDGADTLYGGQGNDALNGGPGSDSLTGGAGDDQLDGGPGTDTVSIADAAAAVSLNLLGGNDSFCTVGSTCGLGYDTIVDGSVESIAGSAFGDSLVGDERGNTISGNGGDDLIDAQGADDTLVGGPGSDALNGGPGTDLASYAAAPGAVTVNLSLGGAQDTVNAGSDTLGGIEGVQGSAYGDNITGTTGPNRLYGLGGNDSLNGDAGNDYLFGQAGVDGLDGGAGTDYCDTGADGGSVVNCEP